MIEDEDEPPCVDPDDPGMEILRAGGYYACGPQRGYEDGWEVWHRLGSEHWTLSPDDIADLRAMFAQIEKRWTGKFRTLDGEFRKP